MKKLANALLFLGLTAGAVLAAVQFMVFTPEAVGAEVLRQIRRGFLGLVKLGGARVHALTSITLTDMSLADPTGQTTFVTLKSATLSLDLWALAGGRIRFSELAIDGLELSLQRGPDGRFTFEPYLPKHTACAPRLRFPVEWLAAAAGEADGPATKEDVDGVSINRVIIRGSRVNYLDNYVPIQIHHITGAMKLDPGQLEILTLRGRAFDRFPVSINGTLAMPGPTHRLEVRLDEAPLKPLLSFIPPLNMLLTFTRESLEGWIGVVIASHEDEHGQGTEIALKFREMRWISHVLASTVNAPRAELTLATKGAGAGFRVEGTAHFEEPLVRPSSFTQDVPLEDLMITFDTPQPMFARLRGYTAKLKSGVVSGAGYLGWGGKPNFQLTFNVERMPLPELGLAGPDSAQMARDALLTLRGNVLPGWVQVTACELALGASRAFAKKGAALVPDALGWGLRDTEVALELDGSDLAKLLGLAGSVKLGGKLTGELQVSGPVGQLAGTGKLAGTRFTLAAASGGESIAVDLDENIALELAGNQLTVPRLDGSMLGGRLHAQVALANQAVSPGGGRMNFEISDADVLPLARLLGAAGHVQSGKIALAGLVGSRVNVGAPAPADPRVTGVLASAPLTATTGTTGTTAAYNREVPPAPPRPRLPPSEPLPQGLIFAGLLEARDVVAPMPPALKAGATRGSPNELRLERASARLAWESDALSIGSIVAAGPAGELTGSVRLEGPGRVSGKLALASADGRVAIDLPLTR